MLIIIRTVWISGLDGLDRFDYYELDGLDFRVRPVYFIKQASHADNILGRPTIIH